MSRKILAVLILLLVIAALAILKVIFPSFPTLLSFQSKNICSQRLGFCTDVPQNWQVYDTNPTADLKTLASSFTCQSNQSTQEGVTTNPYNSGSETAFTVLKLTSPKDISKDPTLSCLVNNCSNFSSLYSREDKTINHKPFIFITSKQQPFITKIYLPDNGGYYAFYFDQQSFPVCGQKENPSSVLKQFLQDFSIPASNS